MPGALAAIVLAGGRGTRLGGTDKALLESGGRTLLDLLLASLDGIDDVVVGPPRRGVRTAREEPPFAGPAAATVAGLVALPDACEVLLLAVDVPGASRAVPLLVSARSGPDGVVALDPDRRTQWLLGRYRADALRDAAARRADWADRPLKELLGGLDVAVLVLPPDATRDVDTVADARAAGVRVPGEEAP